MKNKTKNTTKAFNSLPEIFIKKKIRQLLSRKMVS